MNAKLFFTIIGGDRRQIELTDLLLNKGHRVNILGFDNYKDPRVNKFNSLEARLFNCDALLLPIPYKNEIGGINIKESDIKITLKEVIDYAKIYRPEIFLAKADKDFKEMVSKEGISYIDLTDIERFSILNAIVTAEGAIQRAMETADFTIHGSKILVLGYGRIGKSLSRMLKGIGGDITVGARKEEDLTWAFESGYKSVFLKNLDDILWDQRIIFNTIPHMIMDRSKLLKVHKDAILIDLSSYPGGTDLAFAKELGIKASLDLGLPGKLAPKTAAEIIYSVIIENLGKI